MKKLLILFMILFSVSAFAGFGGSRSSGGGGRSSFSSSRSSSFGGSRSSGRPATISRPSSPRYSAPATTHTHSETVIHRDGGGGGFFNGMLMGTLLSRPVAAPVVVTGTLPVANGGTAIEQPTVVVQNSHPILWFLFGLILLLGLIYVGFIVYKKISEDF